MEPYAINDTIAAISTPPGVGGIAIIRISGPDAVRIVNSAWKGSDLSKVATHTVHLGSYISMDGNVLDTGVAIVFISPGSFTGEDTVELGLHGSSWIQREILNDLVKRGARIANPGEFTQRAFLNGKIDLAQAEGIADLISASSKAAHDIAINQTKGKFSKEFDTLRDKLIEFTSLLELELDFSEEDVEFADRTALIALCDEILKKVNLLASSYSRGQVIKNGVPVVIAGVPNAGKSSLLNLLLNDDKAIVTDIAGTTRDLIEDTVEIDGILYRFIDTAGLRETSDLVEGIGVEKAKEAMRKASIVIWVIDLSTPLSSQYQAISEFAKKNNDKSIIILLNKSDLGFKALGEVEKEISRELQLNCKDNPEIIVFSTLTGLGLPQLLTSLKIKAGGNSDIEKDIIVTNARHYESLIKASEALTRGRQLLLDNISGDFIAQEIREAISHLSTITGTITTDTLLHSIFSRFCIGK